MMKPLSDEILVAYADDELLPAERAAVERRLAHDADARDRLAAFTSTGQWLARAYDDILREPPPASLLAAIRAAGGGGGVPAPARPPLWQRLGGWGFLGPAFGGAGLGIAAGIALMLAIPTAAPERLDPDALLAQALETAASGEPRIAELAGERLEITPIGTVSTAAGTYCREFTEIRERPGMAASVTHGLACREGGGAAGEVPWRSVARIDLTPGGADAPGFGLASGSSQDVFETLLEAVGTTEVLSPPAERQALDEGWR